MPKIYLRNGKCIDGTFEVSEDMAFVRGIVFKKDVDKIVYEE